jgi:methylthioribose-1-phosphate isomerase
MVKTIEWVDGRVVILDQSRLPVEVVYLQCTHYQEVADCIKNLNIRGAPAIGIAAAMGVALAARDIRADNYDGFMRHLEPAFESLLATRPTAVNIKWAAERLRALLASHRDERVDRLKELLKEEAERILEEDREINKAIWMWGPVCS